jgi:predicted alpha/beta-fold hydrolase
MTRFMICCWSEHCMLRPSWWFVTGQNTVCYDQVYDLLLVRTLYVTTKFMICCWSERCMLRPSWWFVTGQNTMVWPSLWFVAGQNAVCYDQVYDLLLVSTLYVTTKFMICYWSEHYGGLVVTWHSDQQQNPNLVVTHGFLTSAKS